MHPLAERVRRTIDRHGLAPPGSRVIVALSGGADSVALVHLLRELRRPCGFLLAGVAHLNHQLRGAAAGADDAVGAARATTAVRGGGAGGDWTWAPCRCSSRLRPHG